MLTTHYSTHKTKTTRLKKHDTNKHVTKHTMFFKQKTQYYTHKNKPHTNHTRLTHTRLTTHTAVKHTRL